MVLGKCGMLLLLFLKNEIHFLFIQVNVKIEDEVERKRIQCYDPEAPITRKGYLICLRTRKPMEIKDTDMANKSAFSF